MAVVSGVFSNRSQYTLVLTVTQTSQNIPGNYSTIGVDLRINESPNWGSWSNAPLTWAWNVNGTVVGSSTTYDFRNYDVLVLYSNSNALNVAHNANGTKSISFSGAVGGGTTIGNASCSGSMTLTTIPRASTPSFVGGATFEAGTTKTINTNRASTSFTHTLQYYIGTSGWQTIATGVGASTTYEFPEDLLEYMPNSPTGAGILRCYTYSGGTNIGVKDIAFTLTTPSDVVPDWDSVSVSEGNDFVGANVGAYVQGVSTLEYEIVGAEGIYGSSISVQRFSVGSQTVYGASGETPLPISGSGTVPVTWLIQDTRGKQKQQTSNITVLPYSLPAISSLEVERALSDGTPDPDEGTYLNVDIIALVQSLMNVTQKNVMQIKIRARELGDETPWDDASTLKETINPGTVTYNDVVTVAGPFAIDKSYEVRVEVVDLFNVAASQATIPVAAVFMHWAEEGLGLGKYQEDGMLDVGGDIYVAGDIFTYDSSSGMVPHVTKALLEDTYIGPGPAKVKFYNGVEFGELSSDEYQWLQGYRPWGNRVVNMARMNGTWVITGHSQEEGFGGQIRLELENDWETYNDHQVESWDNWAEPRAQRLPSGVVLLSGLVGWGTATNGTVIATLPEGYRPDFRLIFPVMNSTNPRSIYIEPTGEIFIGTTNISAGFISLDGIAFMAAGVADWTEVGSGGSSFQNSWVDYGSPVYGVPRYWKDPYGFVWLGGLVKDGSTTSNAAMISLPSDHRAHREGHNKAVSAGTFGFVGTHPDDGVRWKTGSTSNSFVSLDGIAIVTQDAIDNNPWIPAVMANGWVHYSSSFPEPAFLRREDGLATSKGLIRSGTSAPIKVTKLPSHLVPHYSMLMISPSNAAVGRLDIYGQANVTLNADRGAFRVQTGSTSYFSMDNHFWMVGD